MGGIRGLWGTRLTENVQDDKADFQIDATRTDLIGTERIKFNLKTHLRICMSEQLSANWFSISYFSLISVSWVWVSYNDFQTYVMMM